MIGPGGIELFAPDVYNASVGERRRTDYERGRAYGRYEADNSINWMTSCINCAKRLDAAATAFFDGERSGLRTALRTVADGRSSDPHTQAVLDVVYAKLQKLAAAFEDYDRPKCEHVRAEECVPPERPS